MTAKELKNALMQEAIQGKLVPQIASEGNARDLLEEIRKEKAKLIKLGKIKKEKSLPPLTEDEIPFNIPDNWCWCRLGEIGEIARGGSPRPIKDFLTTSEDGYNWIKIGDTDKNGKYINHTAEKIIKEGLRKTRLVHKGDFLLTNSMSFGRPYILNIDGCIHDGWLVISPYTKVFDKEFLYYFLSSSFSFNQFCDAVSGAVVKNLNSDKVRSALIPIPPYEEQKRIVAAIEQFMPLMEEYGKKESELNELNKEIAEKLKNAILQEAIQGKLVPQDPDDEPASVLLERIRKGNSSRQIAAYRKLKPITTEEIPFDIPENWCWCRLGEIIRVVSGISYDKKDVTKTGCRILRGGNIQQMKVLLNEDDVFLPKQYRDEDKLIRKGDILIVASTGSKAVIGKAGYVDRDVSDTMIGAFLRICRPHSLDTAGYLRCLFESDFYRKHIRDLAQGTNINNVKESYVTEFVISLPPFAEQKRIVATIGQLLLLCEKLGE